MNTAELLDLIGNGEDSLVEFKRDEVSNHDLAKELVAFLNLEGGTVLLGVEDDGSIAGVARERLEEWVSELCRVEIEPPIVPLLSWVRDAAPGRDVLAVRVTQGPDKPYGRVHRGRRTFCVRVGSTNREASREEIERMFQAAGRFHYGLKPSLGASFDALDLRRLRDYFERVLGGSAPRRDDREGWENGQRDAGLRLCGRPRHGSSQQGDSRHVGPQRHGARPDRGGVPVHGSALEGGEAIVTRVEQDAEAWVRRRPGRSPARGRRRLSWRFSPGGPEGPRTDGRMAARRPTGLSGRLWRQAVAAALLALLAASCAPQAAEAPAASSRPPNFVVVFADDLGWGDLGSYGAPVIRTPHLDRMAAEGQRWTNFYVTASVCSPSRAGLLTGRLGVRNGLYGDRARVLFPDFVGGIRDEEITLAEALRDLGYATGIFGKWHLGDGPRYLPTRHGFDYWFGIPYSNDMMATLPREERRAAFLDPKIEYWDVPLIRSRRVADGDAGAGDEVAGVSTGAGEVAAAGAAGAAGAPAGEDAAANGIVAETVEQPADQTTITKRYAEEAVDFIRAHADEPFFVYVPHSMPHVPLFRAPAFEGRSEAGLYGDVIEEIDWSVGLILDALEEEGLAENTVVFFSSDNGPWTAFRTQGGLAGPLREGKGMTWDGGMRVPGLFRWPGAIAPRVVTSEIGSTSDLFATFVGLAGGALPDDRPMDSLDLAPVLLGGGEGPREEVPFYRGSELYAYRVGNFKAHFVTRGAYGLAGERTEHDPPLLFDLALDPGEQWDVAAERPEALAEVVSRAARHLAGVEVAPSQFDLLTGGD